MPPGFEAWVEKSIPILGTEAVGKTDPEAVQLLREKITIPEKEAVEIVLFLPLAFSQFIFYDAPWADYYFESYSSRGQTKMLEAENPRLTTIYAVILRYCKGHSNRDYIAAIAWRYWLFRLLCKSLEKGKVTHHVIEPSIWRKLGDPYSGSA